MNRGVVWNWGRRTIYDNNDCLGSDFVKLQQCTTAEIRFIQDCKIHLGNI